MKNDSDRLLFSGFSNIMNKENVSPDIKNYDEIANIILGENPIKEDEISSDVSKHLTDMANRLGITVDMQMTPHSQTPKTFSFERTPVQTPNSSRNRIQTPLNNESPRAMTPIRGTPKHVDTPQKKLFDFIDDEDTDADDNSQEMPINRMENSTKTSFGQRTMDEKYHSQVRSVINNMSSSNTDIGFIDLEEAKREEEKIVMLEEIDTIRSTLEEECVLGLNEIPHPTYKDSYEIIDNTLRRLRLKNDRARYSGLASEIILFGADALEGFFDGKRTFLGKYQPDLTGWNREVKVKLRRMKYDTSTIVSKVMHNFNIGPIMRVLMELFPNMFIFIRNKQRNKNKPNLYDNDSLSRHFDNIRDMDA